MRKDGGRKEKMKPGREKKRRQTCKKKKKADKNRME